MYLHFHPYQTSRLRNGPSKQATSLCVLETPHSSSFPKNLELLQQSLADGWTSATFTIRNMLADHLTSPTPGHWSFGLLPLCYIKCCIRHAYPLICHCYLLLPFAIAMCHFPLPFSFAIAIAIWPFGLLQFCYIKCFVRHEYPAICHCHYHLQLPLVTAMCAFPLALAICCYCLPLPFFGFLLLFLPH